LIRSAGRDDIEAIVRIWREGASHAIGAEAASLGEAELTEFFLQRIRAAESPFGFWVACDQAGEVIGWQALLPFDNNPATCSYVAEWSVYVAGAHARIGVGEALTRHAMKYAREGRLQYLIGLIASWNHRALAMAEKCGWVRVGVLPATDRAPARPEIIIVAFVPAPIGRPRPGRPIGR
jgi:phosphinothricin acetyltransferase